LVFKSLISRVIILNILLLSAGIATFTLFHIRREQVRMFSATRESAKLLLATVENSIFNSMRIGNSEDVQAILVMVGKNPSICNVRIFKPDGTILKSAHPDEIGRSVDTNDFALFRSGRDEGIFRQHGVDVLGMVKPIVSDSRCFGCHGNGRKVIGVLNLNYSLTDATKKVRESSAYFLLSTVFIIVLLSTGVSYILLRLVRRPIRSVVNKMAQVEDGDFSVRLAPGRDDEMGSLIRSFNSMVDKLEKAKQDLQECHYRQMERADRLASVGEMSTGIAHEIKNPLAGISSAISVLADDFEQQDPRREVISKVLEQISRLDKTATDLLYFGRPGTPEFSYVDLNALVHKTLFFISQHPEARNIHRIKDLARDLPPVWVDEKQFQQVLFNIMINAIQAMKEGGSLTIRTSEVTSGAKGLVQLQIADTGPGIPADDLERIFTPFFTTKTQGTGLGLPICRQLIEQHGGTIRVESHHGEGTAFIIELPIVAGQGIEREVSL